MKGLVLFELLLELFVVATVVGCCVLDEGRVLILQVDIHHFSWSFFTWGKSIRNHFFNVFDHQVFEHSVFHILCIKVIRIHTVVSSKFVQKIKALGILGNLVLNLNLICELSDVSHHSLLKLPLRKVEGDFWDLLGTWSSCLLVISKARRSLTFKFKWNRVLLENFLVLDGIKVVLGSLIVEKAYVDALVDHTFLERGAEGVDRVSGRVVAVSLLKRVH
jgi:hypothetical protein